MMKKLAFNIFFFLILMSVILLCIFQKNDKNISLVEIVLNNNQEYIQPKDVYKDVYEKINMDPENKYCTDSIKDINTRLLEDSIETLSYVRNAEVYLSLNNKLTILIQKERPFIRAVIDSDTCFFTQDSIKLNLVEGSSTDVLFFIGDVRSQSWSQILYLANALYEDRFLDSIVTKVSYNQDSGYILHSDLFDFGINIGAANKLDKKVKMIKLFFSSIVKDFRLHEDNELIIKELNVAYDNQVICVI